MINILSKLSIKKETFSLKEFSIGVFPKSDNWEITDKAACKINFFILSLVLEDIFKQDPNRRIKLTFLNLEVIPFGALSSFDNIRISHLSLPKARKIGSYAFSSITSLESVYMPLVEFIGYNAFLKCKSLSNVVLRDSAVSGAQPNLCIEIDAFYGCDSLKSFITNNDFIIAENKVSHKSKHKKVMCNLSTSTKNIILVRYIAGHAFRYHDNLNSVSNVMDVGNNTFKRLEGVSAHKIEIIRDNALRNCDYLINISLLSVGVVEFYAFSYSKQFTTLALESTCETITTIIEKAFYGRRNLRSVVIPSSIVSIEKQAFRGCNNLENITLPETLTSIGKEAFRGCVSLRSITIPNSVTIISGGAFYQCKNLTRIHMSVRSPIYSQMLLRYDTRIVSHE